MRSRTDQTSLEAGKRDQTTSRPSQGGPKEPGFHKCFRCGDVWHISTERDLSKEDCVNCGRIGTYVKAKYI